jgi:hypothetical protein
MAIADKEKETTAVKQAAAKSIAKVQHARVQDIRDHNADLNEMEDLFRQTATEVKRTELEAMFSPLATT